MLPPDRFATAREALAACKPGEMVVRLGRKHYYRILGSEAEALAAAGLELAHVFEHEGRIVSVPIYGRS
jgi:hypothetical protein